VSHIGIKDLRAELNSVFSSKCKALQNNAAESLPAPNLPSAQDIIRSLIMQMSSQRLEKSRECASPYFVSNSIVSAYIDSRLKFCEASGSEPSSFGPTAISCLPLSIIAQRDSPTLCEATSVALHLPLLISSENNSPWLHLERGALVGNCAKQTNIPPNVLTHCLFDWFEKAFSEKDNITCDEWIEHDTYIVTRHNSLDSWHTLSDMWFSFLSAAVFNLLPHSSRVIFADAQPSGPAMPFWVAAFTAAAPLPLQQLAKQAMRRGVRNLCFRRAIFNPPATTSALEHGYQQMQGRTACSDHLLLQAFALHVRLMMNAGDVPTPFDSSTVSLLILKDDLVPTSSLDLFGVLQRHFAFSASIAIASVTRTSFNDIVSSLARTSILLATGDTAAAYVLYLRPLCTCVSLQFDETPLLRMRLITSWARITHYRLAMRSPQTFFLLASYLFSI
jgi:hypothetical protein